jgi:hypothetical protein
MNQLTSQTTSAAPRCKICSNEARHFSRCDFHENVKIHYGFHSKEILKSGVELDYYRCPACGFLFTTFMDDWDGQKFASFIYNKDYPILDGSYNGSRSGALANILYLGFRDSLKELSILDYGGGTGITTALLSAFGTKRAVTYDPFAAGAKRPEGKFNIVGCFEVFEHATNPKELVADLMSLVDPDNGFLFMGTEFQPPDIETQKTGWWYVAPRVGHVSFYTQNSFERLFVPYGMRFFHIEHHTHIAFKQWPVWAHNFFPPETVGG